MQPGVENMVQSQQAEMGALMGYRDGELMATLTSYMEGVQQAMGGATADIPGALRGFVENVMKAIPVLIQREQDRNNKVVQSIVGRWTDMLEDPRLETGREMGEADIKQRTAPLRHQPHGRVLSNFISTLVNTSMRTGARDKQVMEATESKMRTLNRGMVAEFKTELKAYEGHMKRLATTAKGKDPEEIMKVILDGRKGITKESKVRLKQMYGR